MMMKTRSGNARFMKPVNNAISACRHCRFYNLEGRRGGFCQQLGVPVQGSWKACSLAMQPFASEWNDWSGIAARHSSGSDPQPALASEHLLQNSLHITLPEIEPVATTAMIEEVSALSSFN